MEAPEDDEGMMGSLAPSIECGRDNRVQNVTVAHAIAAVMARRKESPMRPTRDRTLMAVAQAFSQRSTCDRLHVGAVVAREGRILSTGYNGTPSGLPHCIHSGLESEPGCTKAVHAEANAIAWAARHGVMLLDADLYTTHMPCYNCATLIVNSGIAKVVYGIPYRLSAGMELLHEAGVKVDRLSASR